MLDGDRANAGGVKVDGDDRLFGYDGIPTNAALRQFNDMSTPTRTWRLEGKDYRESAGGGVELLALAPDGRSGWIDYSHPYFSTADEMSAGEGEPGEAGHGLRARQAWDVAHEGLLRAEAFDLSTDRGSSTPREQTLLLQRQQQRAVGERGLGQITASALRAEIAGQDAQVVLNDETRESREWEARLERLQAGRQPETGTREAVLQAAQVRALKDKIGGFGEAVGRGLPEDIGAEDLTDEDLTAIYGSPDSWPKEPGTNGYHDTTHDTTADTGEASAE